MPFAPTLRRAVRWLDDLLGWPRLDRASTCVWCGGRIIDGAPHEECRRAANELRRRMREFGRRRAP
jgi:hypothetical protein